MKHLSFKLAMFVTIIFICMPHTALAAGKGLAYEWVKEDLASPLVAVSSDGSVLIADGGQLFKLTGSGAQKWGVKLGEEVRFLEADANGGCWAAFSKGVVRVLPTGKVSWTYSCDEGITCLEPLPDGRVLVGTELGGFLLDEDGRFVWLYDPATGCDT